MKIRILPSDGRPGTRQRLLRGARPRSWSILYGLAVLGHRLPCLVRRHSLDPLGLSPIAVETISVRGLLSSQRGCGGGLARAGLQTTSEKDQAGSQVSI